MNMSVYFTSSICSSVINVWKMGLYGYKAEIIDMSVGRLYHSYVAAWEATKGYPHKRKNSHELQ